MGRISQQNLKFIIFLVRENMLCLTLRHTQIGNSSLGTLLGRRDALSEETYVAPVQWVIAHAQLAFWLKL